MNGLNCSRVSEVLTVLINKYQLVSKIHMTSAHVYRRKHVHNIMDEKQLVRLSLLIEHGRVDSCR